MDEGAKWISWNLRRVWYSRRLTFVQLLEAGVGIGPEVELQMLAWVLAPAIGRVGEPHGRRGWITGSPVIAT